MFYFYQVTKGKKILLKQIGLWPSVSCQVPLLLQTADLAPLIRKPSLQVNVAT